jgi:macrolide transport system ATP-binding/permease protein
LNQPVLQLRNVARSYVVGEHEVKALDGVELDIYEGSFTALVGTSGSGKSTLLHILACQDNASSGEMILNGQSIADSKDKDLAFYRNQWIGIVFQQFNLLSELTVLENIALPLAYQGVSKQERLNRALMIAEKVGLKDRVSHKPNELSGGQAQRVAIARALVTNPKILLADEPTGALDSNTGREIMELFHQLHREGVTIVMVTHDLNLAKEADIQVRMKDGLFVEAPKVENQSVSHHIKSPLKHSQGLGVMDLIRMGFMEGLLAHKLRTMLTMLGVIIGVASVISMSSFTEGSKQKQINQIRALGANMIKISDKKLEGLQLNQARLKGSWGLQLEEVLKLYEQIPAIQKYAVKREVKLNFSFRNTQQEPKIFGVQGDFLEVNNLSLSTGRWFSEIDQENANRVLVMGKKMHEMIGSPPLDTLMYLAGDPYRLIGVMDLQSRDSDLVDAVAQDDPSVQMFVPLQTLLQRTRQLVLRSEIDEVQFQLEHEDQLNPVSQLVRNYLLSMHQGQEDFSMVVPMQLLKAKQDSQKLLDVLSICICAISMVVGGIGIMNIMLASVRERRREIGIRRAIGATMADIKRQFLTESIMISCTGSLVGLGLAFVCVVILATMLLLPITFSPVVICMALGASFATGLGFGYYPAHLAAHQNLVEILRVD